MKKLISLALTLAMLCCMATTASAAKVSVVGAVTTNNVSGTPTHVDGSLDNGVGNFDSANTSYEVQINVTTNTTVDKYAVDIDYDASALVITGATMTWDVNTMTYKITTAGSGGDANLTKDINITNYSNKPVNAHAAVTKNATYVDSPVEITSSNPEGSKLTVPAATPGVGTNGTAGTGKVTITLDPTGAWDDVTAYLTAKGAGGTVTLATATLYITK